MARVVPQADIEAALRREPGVTAACEAVAEAVIQEARNIVLVSAYDTGELASGMHVVRGVDGGAVARSSARHAAPVEGGTGIFGPRRARIYAKPGRPFVFYTRLSPRGTTGRLESKILGGVSRKLVLTSHRGMPGVHPMERAGTMVAAQSNRLTFHAGPWVATD